jgi:anaerobic magnesium-protoporphyrin IX monomethyl ester cyclase
MKSLNQNVVDTTVLVIDLNNYATFPTIAVGILIASLREAGCDVSLVTALSHDLSALSREKKESFYHYFQRRVNLSTWKHFHSLLVKIRKFRLWWRNRPETKVLRDVEYALKQSPSVVLLSAYLQHYPLIYKIGNLAKKYNVPLVLGGPVFNHDLISKQWLDIPNLKAIVGAEVDNTLPSIVDAVVEGKNLLNMAGVFLPDGNASQAAKPLRPLNRIPLPDYTDFPWHRYPSRLIPIMTGRGCQWAKCTFCSDVYSVNGRTFRTRNVESVLYEMQELSRRHASTDFVFTDIKLNSNPAMIRGLTEQIQHFVHGAQWVGTVHVDQRKDNGLSRRDLRDAAKSGMRRVSFGLESGSQRMLDLMDKGCSVSLNEEFIRNAFEAGISVRATMFKGYPGETANDLELTIKFLEKNATFIDRIRFNDFSIHTGIPLYDEVLAFPDKYPQIKVIQEDAKYGKLVFKNIETETHEYREAKIKLLKLVHQINKKEIRASAKNFDGVM